MIKSSGGGAPLSLHIIAFMSDIHRPRIRFHKAVSRLPEIV
jgi:hypothetical protein